jgi:hypothetical protein
MGGLLVGSGMGTVSMYRQAENVHFALIDLSLFFWHAALLWRACVGCREFVLWIEELLHY